MSSFLNTTYLLFPPKSLYGHLYRSCVEAGNHKCNTGSTVVSYNLLEQLLWPKAEIIQKPNYVLQNP